MDDGNGGSFSTVVGYSSDYTSTSVTITTGITSGKTYLFKYRAKNIFGWGSFSNTVSITAMTIPTAPG